MGDKIRIAIVDDHPLLREGVMHTLSSHADLEVVAEGASGADAVRIAEEWLPDVMLLDVSLPGGGVEAVRSIAISCPVVKIAMLTVAQDEETVSSALGAGARGYILKGISGQELAEAVRNINSGEDYVSPGLAARLLAEMGSKSAFRHSENYDVFSSLSLREESILVLVADGLSNRQVGEKLNLSEKTIKHYMTNILQKLRVKNRVEAALLAQKHRVSSADR